MRNISQMKRIHRTLSGPPQPRAKAKAKVKAKAKAKSKAALAAAAAAKLKQEQERELHQQQLQMMKMSNGSTSNLSPISSGGAVLPDQPNLTSSSNLVNDSSVSPSSEQEVAAKMHAKQLHQQVASTSTTSITTTSTAATNTWIAGANIWNGVIPKRPKGYRLRENREKRERDSLKKQLMQENSDLTNYINYRRLGSHKEMMEKIFTRIENFTKKNTEYNKYISSSKYLKTPAQLVLYFLHQFAVKKHRKCMSDKVYLCNTNFLYMYKMHH